MKIITNNSINELEMADIGLHDFIINKINLLEISKKSKILILGCGRGGIDKKLLNLGFSNITSVDINISNYFVENTNLIKWDLNLDFNWDNKTYDLILAIEVIEHIYSTHHFICEISKKLHNNGILLLTTPNILRKVSKANLILFNYFCSFDTVALDGWGHINPIFPHILERFIKEQNLKIVEKLYNRKDFDQIIIRSWKTYIYWFVMFFFSNFLKFISFNKKHSEGVISVYVIKKLKKRFYD